MSDTLGMIGKISGEGSHPKPKNISVNVEKLHNGYNVKHGGGALDGQIHAAQNDDEMHAMIAKHFGHSMVGR